MPCRCPLMWIPRRLSGGGFGQTSRALAPGPNNRGCRAPALFYFRSKYSNVPSPSCGDCPGSLSVMGLTKRECQGFIDMIAAIVLLTNDWSERRLPDVRRRSEILNSARLPSAVAKETVESIRRSWFGSGWRTGLPSSIPVRTGACIYSPAMVRWVNLAECRAGCPGLRSCASSVLSHRFLLRGIPATS
jgi:hypothetical protein